MTAQTMEEEYKLPFSSFPLKTCDKFMPSLKVKCKISLSLSLENNFEDLLEYGDELNKMAT